MSKLQLADLLNTLATPTTTTKQAISSTSKKATKATQQFMINNNMKVKQIKKSEQSRMKKQMNYKATQQDMDKWIGIVKVNRQKQTLDLTNKQRANVNINFFPSKPVSALQQKTDNLLKQLSMQSSASIMKAQQQQLEKLDPQQAKRRLVQARKHRTMVFYEQIKRRRIAKIKSKVYHKIKKRQKLRDEEKRLETMSPHEKSQYMQKLMKNRIKQRISLRHNSKNKHIQNLLRFSKYNKDGVQQAMNEVNLIRQKQLERGDKIDEEILGNIEEEYDDENYRQQAIGELQRELARMEQQSSQQEGNENRKKLGLQGMKFMQVARQKQQQKDIDDAYKLINQLKDQQSQDIMIEDSDQQDDKNKTLKNRDHHKSNSDQFQQVTRKTYGQSVVQKQHKQQQLQQQSKKKQFIKKNIHQTLLLGQNVQELTKGLDVQKLKDKYQPQRVQLKLNEELIEMNRNIFNNNSIGQEEINNQAILENLRDFQQDKYQNFQQSIEPQKKRLQGWGSWAGPSIKQPKVDPQLEIKKKLAKIQEIKRKRKDGELTNVIINEVRNKQLKDYMVQKLPHQFSNVEQFEYMNQTEIGPEWNSLTQFKANIKPKVVTKVGEVIEPIRAPKKINKL